MLDIVTQQKILALGNDNESGGSEIALKAVSIFFQVAERSLANLEMLTVAADALINAKPDMAAVKNIVKYTIGDIKQNCDRDKLGELRESIIAKIKEASLETARLTAEHIKRNFAKPFTVVTCSFSGAVKKVIQSLAMSGALEGVIAMESKFGDYYYGNFVNKYCFENNINCETVPDAEMETAIQRAVIAVTGADKIFADGSAVNGYPSLKLAEHCKGKIPYIIAAESYKLTCENPNEHLPQDGFEIIPHNLISGIISDGYFQRHS